MIAVDENGSDEDYEIVSRLRAYVFDKKCLGGLALKIDCNFVVNLGVFTIPTSAMVEPGDGQAVRPVDER